MLILLLMPVDVSICPGLPTQVNANCFSTHHITEGFPHQAILQFSTNINWMSLNLI